MLESRLNDLINGRLHSPSEQLSASGCYCCAPSTSNVTTTLLITFITGLLHRNLGHPFIYLHLHRRHHQHHRLLFEVISSPDAAFSTTAPPRLPLAPPSPPPPHRLNHFVKVIRPISSRSCSPLPSPFLDYLRRLWPCAVLLA